jgi:hypothetical protein
MEDLGSMELGRLLQLFAGSLACAFIVFLFIIAYVVLTRRASRRKKEALQSTGGTGQEAPALQYRVDGSPAAGGEVRADEPSPIDVSARLAGTGRDAWLEEASSHPLGTAAAGEYALDHGRELLRLVRESTGGQVWTQVAGMRYRNLNEIRDRAVGERVLAAITYLLRFSNAMVATDQGVVTLDLPPCDAVKVPAGFGILSEAHELGEMMRLMSNPDQNHFCVHVADHCYRRLADVEDRATGQIILIAITRLLQFSNGMLATNDGFGVVFAPPLAADADTPLPAPLTRSGSDPQSSTPSPTPSSVPLTEQERFLRQLESQTSAQVEAPIERPSLLSGLRRMRKKPSTEEPLPSLNLADEIDRIFQTKLAASALALTSASIETNPDGGIRIRVGTDYYNSPDEVPDAHLRDLLKLSIAEWEQS